MLELARRGALRRRARGARHRPRASARRDRRPDRPERRRQVDDAPCGDGRRRRSAAGEILLHGALAPRPQPGATSRARGVALVPEGRHIFASLTVAENLRLGLAGAAQPRRASPTTSRGCTALFPVVPTSRGGTRARSRAASSSSSRSRARSSRGPTCCCSTSRRSASRRRSSRRCSRRSAGSASAASRSCSSSSAAQLTIAFADRTHVIANAELRLTLGRRADAGDDRASSRRRTSRELVVPGNRRRDLARRGLRARRGRDRSRLRRDAADQLRLRRADHRRRLHARLHERLAARRSRSSCASRSWSRSRSCRSASRSGRCAQGASPAAMLVATFAVSFLLQSDLPARVRLARPDRRHARPAEQRRSRSDGVDIRWIALVAHRHRSRAARSRTGALLEPHDDRPARARRRAGLPHRAHPRRAREPRDRVLVRRLRRARGRGQRAAHRLERRSCSRRFGVPVTIFALVGVVVGGLDRLWTRGARRLRRSGSRRRCSATCSRRAERLPAVGRLRRRDPRAARAARRPLRAVPRAPGGARMRRARRRARRCRVLARASADRARRGRGVAGAPARVRERAREDGDRRRALRLHRQLRASSRSATSASSPSARTSPGILTVDPETKNFMMPGIFPCARPHARRHGRRRSRSRRAAGGVFALAVGMPLMRLSGLPAGIATFAVLGITYNVLYYWQKIGPRRRRSPTSRRPGSGRSRSGTSIAIVVAFAYQRSRFGRMLRATREDPRGRRRVGHLRPPPAAARRS